jgi:hypothetical protein
MGFFFFLSEKSSLARFSAVVMDEPHRSHIDRFP